MKRSLVALAIGAAVFVAPLLLRAVVDRVGPGRPPPAAAAGLPRFVDLGATTCVPCRVMLGVVEELRRDYAGVLAVEFVDVGEGEAMAAHGIRAIPTQIFYAPDGRELYRHTGLLRREAVVAKWAELGFPLEPAAGPVALLSDLVFRVNDALGASLAVALLAALVWGLASVLLSPCHLGTIPLVVGIVGANARPGARRSGVVLSLAFAGGMLASIAVLGGVALAAGRALQGLGPATNLAIAALFAVAGLNLVGLVSLPIPRRAPSAGNRTGAWAAAALGLVLGLGLSPCTFAFLAPILGVAFGAAAAAPLRGAALLLVFGVGHCAVLAAAGTSAGLVQRYLDWNGESRALGLLKAGCGILVLVAAAGLVYVA